MGAVDSTAKARQAVYQARAVNLATGVLAPLNDVARRVSLGVLGAAGIAFVAGLVFREPLVSLIVGAGLCAGVAAVVSRRLLDPDLRAAIELRNDHDCHERAEWKADTRTSMPRTPRAAAQWLLAHPRERGRAALLVALGRLDEADQAIAEVEPRTPEEAFGLEILRQRRRLLADEPVDGAALHEQWRKLPLSRERRHRRQCLALLDAQVAFDAGRAPLVALATGRAEAGEVHRTMRIEWIVGQWVVAAALLVCAVTIIVGAIVA